MGINDTLYPYYQFRFLRNRFFISAPSESPFVFEGAPTVGSAPPGILAPLTVRGGRVLATSRDVAAMFGKEHKHILRDIAGQEIGPDLGRSFFIPTTTPDSYGRPQPGFDMTRDGFTLLAMGFTGKEAVRFKLAYIAEAKQEAIAAGIDDNQSALLRVAREVTAEKRMPSNFASADCNTA